MVCALELIAEGCGMESRWVREKVQTFSRPSSYSTFPKEYKMDRESLGDRWRYKVRMSDP